MNVGEVRVAADEDFTKLKQYADNDTGWKLEYSKSSTKVWTKLTPSSSFKMIKIKSTFSDVNAAIVYDVLHDPEYRKIWDTHMLKSYDIGCLNPNNDIGYYSMHCPYPLKNRDFVLQRSWLETVREYMVLNHSVFHETAPPIKGFIRAISFMTGFIVRPIDDNSCELIYVTQSDPRGSLPPWMVNKLTQIFAPKMVKRVHKACLGYEKWKKKHNPHHKPWLYPEQIITPRINLAQCVKKEDEKALEDEEEEGTLDESKLTDRDFLDNEDDAYME